MRTGRIGLLLVLLALVAGEAAAQGKPPLPPPPRDPHAGPYDMKGLGLGTEATVIVTFASEDCAPCVQAIPFYKRLLALPRMDGKARRFIVVAVDGLWPVKDVLAPHAFEPHRLTTGPYPARRLPGVVRTPALLLLDRAGRTIRVWEGPLSSAQQQEIIAAINRLTPGKG